MASIRKNPRSRAWEVRYRSPDGRQRTKGGFKTKGDALAHKASIEHKINVGEWRDPTLGRMTVEEWCDDYLAGAAHKRAATLHRDRGSLNRYVLPIIGTIPMAKVTPRDIRLVFDPLTCRLAPSTIRGVWATVAHVFKTAVEADVIAVTPCRGVRLPKASPTPKRFLSAQEVALLAAAIDPLYRAWVTLAAYGGLRFSELAGLRVRSIDFLKRQVTVAETVSEVAGHIGINDTKTPASRRTVSLPASVVQDLSAMLAARGGVDRDDWLFQSPRGGPLRYSNFHRTVWAPAVRASGLGGLTMHGLRHTSVGLLIETGAHPRTIQHRLGHSRSSTTMDVYGSLLPSVEARAAEDLEALIVGVGGADVVQPRTGLSGV